MQIVHLTYLGMGQFITIDAKVAHVPKIGLMYHWFIMLSYLLAKVRIQFCVDDTYHYSYQGLGPEAYQHLFQLLYMSVRSAVGSKGDKIARIEGPRSTLVEGNEQQDWPNE